jgi:hypothetical protein
LLTLTGDGWLPLQETQTFFVDDPGKLYRQRRRATQAKGLETLDSKVEVEGPPESPRESPPPSPKEDQPKPTSLIYLSRSKDGMGTFRNRNPTKHHGKRFSNHTLMFIYQKLKTNKQVNKNKHYTRHIKGLFYLIFFDATLN